MRTDELDYEDRLDMVPYEPYRLKCMTCGSDLGDGDDPYRDPACITCIERENQEDAD